MESYPAATLTGLPQPVFTSNYYVVRQLKPENDSEFWDCGKNGN
jgi:hypothetical protein